MSTINTVKELLLMSNYYSLNKTLVKKLGIEQAFFICLLADAEQVIKVKTNDEFFFQTIEDIEERSGLTPHKQRKIIEELKEKELIETDLRGIPAKRYFKLNYENISKYVFEEVEEDNNKNDENDNEEVYSQQDIKNFNNLESTHTSCEKTSQQDVKNFNNCTLKNSTSIIDKEINKEIKDKENNPPISPLGGNGEGEIPEQEINDKKTETENIETKDVKSKNKKKESDLKEKSNKAIRAITRDKEMQQVIKEFADTDLEMIDAIKAFYKSRKALRKTLTARALKLNLNELKRLSEDKEEQIAIINQSIAKGWQSFYELPKDHPIKQKKGVEHRFGYVF